MLIMAMIRACIFIFTTENENIVIMKVHLFALNIQNSDGCYESYQLATSLCFLLPLFSDLAEGAVIGPAVVVARVLLWGSGVTGWMATPD
jgi:hypothetical protein